MNPFKLNIRKGEDLKKAAVYGAGALAITSLGYFAYQKYLENCEASRLLEQALLQDQLKYNLIYHKAPNCAGIDKRTAEIRRNRIEGGINYDLYLIFHETQTKFQGNVTIEFKKTIEEGDLWLDFTGEILRLEINDQVQKDSYFGQQKNYDHHLLRLDQTLLKSGTNIVSIDFEHEYSIHGAGLNCYTETNGDKYLFSWNETYGCRHIFPNFDQPDIKGQLKLYVSCPSKWNVISNEKKKGKSRLVGYKASTETMSVVHKRLLNEVSESDRSDYEIHDFIRTKKIPSYVFSVNVGPWVTITYPKSHKGAKISIHGRKSRIDELKACSGMMFELQAFALKQMEKLCGMPYQFSKYDTIFTPNCSVRWSAAENPGCVNFVEGHLNLNRLESILFLHMVN